jgi:replicative DNA helicase
MPTGIGPLDDIIHGLMTSRVSVVAGGTGHGKSLFVDQILVNMAKRAARMDKKVVFVKFSCEDDLSANKIRLTTNLTGSFKSHGVPIRAIEEHMQGIRQMTDQEDNAVRMAIETLKGLDIIIDEYSTPDRTHILSRLTAASALGEIGGFIFDYLEFTGEKAPTKNQAIDQTMVVLHEMAKRFGCWGIAISQLKEQVSDRENGTPTLADLSWSAFIKKIAPQVIMVQHPWEHWNQMGRVADEPPRNDFFIHVRKNKGTVGSAKVQIYPESLRIEAEPTLKMVF